MLKNHHQRTWRHQEITSRQHDLLLLLAAGYSDEQICSRYAIRHNLLDHEVEQLKVTYHANNARMLISLALLDDEISLAEILPHVIALLNGPKSKNLDG